MFKIFYKDKNENSRIRRNGSTCSKLKVKTHQNDVNTSSYFYGQSSKRKQNLQTVILCMFKVNLTFFFPLFSFDPPENIRKPKAF